MAHETVLVSPALLMNLQSAQAVAQQAQEDLDRVASARRLLEEFGELSGPAHEKWKIVREAAYGLYLVLTEEALLAKVRAHDAETALYRALETAEQLALALPEAAAR